MPAPTYDLPPTTCRLILLDIEGTTTPIDFVSNVLFPYARHHVKEFLLRHHHSADLRAAIEGLRKEHVVDAEQGLNPPLWPLAAPSERPGLPGSRSRAQAPTAAPEESRRSETAATELESIDSVVAYVHWLMDRDRKSTALKSLQGKIWETGYQSGELRGEVYADVPPAFARWQSQGKDICIFSSGSVLAQKLLFAHTVAGDLTRFIREYFDTTTGAKTETDSYQRIANAVRLPPPELLFVSDVLAELDAARVTGTRTVLCVRPGRSEPDSTTHPPIRTFDEVFPWPGAGKARS